MSSNDSIRKQDEPVFSLEEGSKLLMKSLLAIEKNVELSSQKESPVTDGFTQMLQAFVKYAGLTCCETNEFTYKVYEVYLRDALKLNQSYNVMSQLSLMTLDLRKILALIRYYFRLPVEDRVRAEIRSNKLIEIFPGCEAYVHEIVWFSVNPVEFITHTDRPKPCSKASYWQIEAFKNGHNTSISETYGYYSLMLLKADELQEATKIFTALNPGVSLKEMEKIAKFKHGSMTVEVYLGLLKLGYASVDQIREAGKLLGVSTRKRDYFNLVLAGGKGLAEEAKRLVASVSCS